jgi:hypothetical protein
MRNRNQGCGVLRKSTPDAAQARGAAMRKYFGPAAGSEALFRAFLAERDGDRRAALFWIEVYRIIMDGSGEVTAL